jgi:6-pyruvoyl-tetrahydropterin synthase
MESFTEVTAKFDASHQVAHPARCASLHGHTFTVRVFVRADAPQLQDLLSTILYELNDRDLNLMMIGGEPTLSGIARWLAERLVEAFPNLEMIEVEDGRGLAGGVTRTKR